MLPSQSIMFSSFSAYTSEFGYQLWPWGVITNISSVETSSSLVGLQVRKYEKIPRRDRATRNPESGNHTEWVVSSGSGIYILGTSLTTIFVSRSIKGGIKLCVVELTNKAFWHTSRYVFLENGQSYAIIASTMGTFSELHRTT